MLKSYNSPRLTKWKEVYGAIPEFENPEHLRHMQVFQGDLKWASAPNAFHLGEWMQVSDCPTFKLSTSD